MLYGDHIWKYGSAIIIGTEGARRLFFCTGAKTFVCAEIPIHTNADAKRDKIFFIFFTDLRKILLLLSSEGKDLINPIRMMLLLMNLIILFSLRSVVLDISQFRFSCKGNIFF